MTTGGLRARLIRDSFYNWVKDGVVARGWTDTGRRHTPFQFVPQPATWDEEVPLNSIAVSSEDVTDELSEMGSNRTEDTWTFYVDVYAEAEQVGMDCAHDIRDILRGKMPSIGRTRQSFPVYDYRMATPVVLFYCEMEDVVADRARNFNEVWRRNWFVIRVSIVDSYDVDVEDYFGDEPVAVEVIESGGPP